MYNSDIRLAMLSDARKGDMNALKDFFQYIGYSSIEFEEADQIAEILDAPYTPGIVKELIWDHLDKARLDGKRMSTYVGLRNIGKLVALAERDLHGLDTLLKHLALYRIEPEYLMNFKPNLGELIRKVFYCKKSTQAHKDLILQHRDLVVGGVHRSEKGTFRKLRYELSFDHHYDPDQYTIYYPDGHVEYGRRGDHAHHVFMRESGYDQGMIYDEKEYEYAYIHRVTIHDLIEA